MSRTTDFLSRELKAVGIVTAYFLAWFCLIGYLKSLMLAQYNVSYVAAGSALVGSLIIAKVVVILDETRVGDRFSRHVQILHVVYKSLVYTFFVALVMVLERLVEGMLDGKALAVATQEIWKKRNGDHILVSIILMTVAFLFYNTFAVVNRALGDAGLAGLLFRRSATGN